MKYCNHDLYSSSVILGLQGITEFREKQTEQDWGVCCVGLGVFPLLFGGTTLCFGCCFLVHLCESMSKQTETLSRECHALKCRDANPNIASHCQIQKLVASCMSFEVQGCASMECISIQKSDGSYSDSDSNNDLLAVNLTVFGHT